MFRQKKDWFVKTFCNYDWNDGSCEEPQRSAAAKESGLKKEGGGDSKGLTSKKRKNYEKKWGGDPGLQREGSP